MLLSEETWQVQIKKSIFRESERLERMVFGSSWVQKNANESLKTATVGDYVVS